MKLLVFCLVSLSVWTLSSSASIQNDAKLTGRDKRAGEVIFFENAQKRADPLAKRSEQWPILKNTAEPTAKSVDPSTKSSSQSSEDGTSELDDMAYIGAFISEMEEEAFEKALNFLITSLLDDAYDEELANYYSLEPTTEMSTPTMAAMFSSTPALPKEGDPEKALASLIAEQNRQASQPDIPVEVRADDSYRMDNLQEGSNQLTMEDADAPLEPSEEGYEELKLGSMNVEDEEKLLQSFEYLKKILNFDEGKLRDIVGYGKDDSSAGADSEPHSRKRRSISDDRYYASKRSGEPNGVCFDAEEVAELREILLSLAKDGMKSKETIDYLLNADDEGDWFDELPETYETADSRYASGSRISGSSSSEDAALSSLASRLNQRRPSMEYQMPAAKRYYGLYNNPYAGTIEQ